MSNNSEVKRAQLLYLTGEPSYTSSSGSEVHIESSASNLEEYNLLFYNLFL